MFFNTSRLPYTLVRFSIVKMYCSPMAKLPSVCLEVCESGQELSTQGSGARCGRQTSHQRLSLKRKRSNSFAYASGSDWHARCGMIDAAFYLCYTSIL